MDMFALSLLLLTVVISSALFFQCCNWALNWLPVLGRTGQCKKFAGTEKHKWRNAAVSLLNSAVVSSLVVICFCWYPELRADITYYNTPLIDVTFAVLVGYYFYDLCDIVNFNRFSTVWPLIGHHVTGIGLLTLIQRYQIGMGVVLFALFCEVNAVFLHLRQVLLMHGICRESSVFRIVKIVNVSTFVTFRLFPMIYSGYVTWTQPMPAVLAYSTPACNIVIVTVNIVLFRRVVYNDFIRNDSKKGVEQFITDR